MAPLLSVVTATRNAAATVAETLASIPTHLDEIEHIVVDGGSTDKTVSIVRQASPQSLILQQQGTGISSAFNEGVSAANGQYIAILNGDDYYLPGACERRLTFLKAQGFPDMVHGPIAYQPEQGDNYLEYPNPADIWKFMSLFHPSIMAKRSLFDRFGLFSEDYELAMDSEWVHRVVAADVNLTYCDEVLATMRLGGSSHRNHTRSLWEFRRSVRRHGPPTARANYYFIRQLIVQSLLKFRVVREFNLKRRA